jgi:PhzF family phenazine biosynthesis protein
MTHELVIVDAFTDRAFRGNPAGVCLLNEPGDEGWMSAVAREVNLSETAFVLPRGNATYGIRWFTPGVEVDLCGHATLASAHVLWETGRVDRSSRVQFESRSGPLPCDAKDGWITMDFPSSAVALIEPPIGLADALGVPIRGMYRTRFDVLVELDSEALIRKVRPDFRALAEVEARGVIVTARSDDRAFEFVSRFFAPRSGVAEDPVTGSAHCALGPFWGERLGLSELRGLQVSARGGVVNMRLAGERILLSGQAVTSFRGQLIPDSFE